MFLGIEAAFTSSTSLSDLRAKRKEEELEELDEEPCARSVGSGSVSEATLMGTGGTASTFEKAEFTSRSCTVRVWRLVRRHLTTVSTNAKSG